MNRVQDPLFGRPWPAPRAPWAMHMEWDDLLFIHWPVDPLLLRSQIPPGLELELFEGEAWLGLVPFRMREVGPRFFTWLPYMSAFIEMNVRTYVTAGGKPGVWFFSLDATNPLAVQVARLAFHLPYFDARMLSARKGDWVYYKSVRTHPGAPPATFAGRYRPMGPFYYSEPGTLEHWLTERYCLYSANRLGHIWRCEINHARWPLQPAELQTVHNTTTEQLGFSTPDKPPLLHFARQLNVVAWPPRRIALSDWREAGTNSVQSSEEIAVRR